LHDAFPGLAAHSVSRAVGGEPRLFKDSWLRQLGSVCGLGEAELDLLARSRDDEGYPVDPLALRAAIARTLRAHPIETRLSAEADAGAAAESTDRGNATTGASLTLGGGMAGAGGAVATRALPRDIGSFIGRQPELRQLVEAAAGSPRPGVVSIHAIGGMAGIGKTTLAVHAAHQLAPRFPDGQIFLPLHGHTPGQRPVIPPTRSPASC
jgi:hypothetical protein